MRRSDSFGQVLGKAQFSIEPKNGKASRFSIDIDIICKAERKDLEQILNKVIENSHFTAWKLNERRSYQPGVPKAHYKFSFDTKQQGSGTILLDVLIEDSIYPALAELPVNTKWIETEVETMVTVPTIDAIEHRRYGLELFE